MPRAPRRTGGEDRLLSKQIDIEHDYRTRLQGDAVLPWSGSKYQPVTHGPVWSITDSGRWFLPELTLGWEFLGWTTTHLVMPGEEPYEWRWTDEQARFWLWWFAVDENLRWLYRDGTYQRMKGAGKDPMAAGLSPWELVGPCVPTKIIDGEVVGRQHPAPWVDIAAVTQHQTKTTMSLLPAMIPERTMQRYRIRPPGKITMYARADQAQLFAVTSNPSALEGNRSSLVIGNEVHHWREANSGHEMEAVLKRNAVKAKGGGARLIRFTNAYQRGEDSVAERDHNAYKKGETKRYLYDTLEAPKGAPLEGPERREIINITRGDSWWLDEESIADELDDARTPPSQKRRFWYNQVEATEDAWVDPRAWDDIEDEDLMLYPGEPIFVFFDGSKSDDATVMVGCRESDGGVFLLGIWQKPPKLAGTTEQRRQWRVSRDAVDYRMVEVMETYDVLGIWADPSDVMDEDGNSFWTPVADAWHRRWKDHLVLPAQREKNGHSIIWDMRGPLNQRLFTEAAMQCVDDIERLDFRHNGDRRLARHVENAVKWPGKYGVSLGKRSRESQDKVDAAVAMVGARMMRRAAVTLGKDRKRRSGRVR